MATPILPAHFTFTEAPTTFQGSSEYAISPSQPLPAEHPSHSRDNSKDSQSTPPVAPPTDITPKSKTLKPRGKSNSLSFPVLVNNATSSLPVDEVQADIRPFKKPTNALRITVPTVPTSNESTFLTSLAAQERHVLELREELAKAEESLSNLKRQWTAHECRRRESETRRLHKMKTTSSDVPPTPRFPALAGGSTTPRAMFEEMQRRNASTDQGKQSSRRRRFSGSRQIRALSLVSPDIIKKFAELDAASQNEGKQETVQSPTLADSLTQTPPTPDLVHEEDDDDTETASNSQRSSQSPKQRRQGVHASMQMAADFREGLWTFFEDLKHATYGDEARAPPTKEDHLQRIGARSGRGKLKRALRRQTWQVRPEDFHDTLVGVDGQHYEIPTKQDIKLEEKKATPTSRNSKEIRRDTYIPGEHQLPVPAKSPPRNPVKPTNTPQRLYEKEIDGEVWQTWDTPKSRSQTTTPIGSRSRNSSTDTVGRQQAATAEHGKRGSLGWPSLTKLKPSQLTRPANQLLDELEKSLNHDGRASPRPASPRPVSKRSNSRLDENYDRGHET